MKIRSKAISTQLEAMGWTREGDAKVNAVVGIYDQDDPRASAWSHDFYYGPLVIRKELSAIKMRRPVGVSRKQEREVMQLLLAWQEVINMMDRRGHTAHRGLGKAACALLMAAVGVVRENE